MFERVRARDGRLVAKFNGRWVASSANPEAEAEKWLSAQENLQLASQAPTIVILGAGCGYHLLATQKKYPEKRIVCIDTRMEFIDFCDEHHGVGLARTQFIQTRDVPSLLVHAKLQKIIQGAYAVFEYLPATQFEKDLYDEIRALLLGREWWAFREIVQKREDLRKHLMLSTPAMDVNELVSVKTIIKLLKENADPEVVTRFKLLRELVK